MESNMERILRDHGELIAVHTEKISNIRESIDALGIYTTDAIDNIQEHNKSQNGHITNIDHTLTILDERTKGLRSWIRLVVLLMLLHITGLVMDFPSLVAWAIKTIGF